jgi:tetratricopeptide (TPR) repeat protein
MAGDKRLHPIGHRRRIVVGCIAAIVVSGVAAIAKWPHAWPWLTVGAAGVAAFVVPAVTLWNDARQRRADTARVVRTHAHGTKGSQGGELPLVKEMDLRRLRVHTAVVDVPYVRRDEELLVRDHLRAGRPVLIVGSSMVGKTRMAAEVVKDMFPDRPIVVPDTKAALKSLDAADLDLRECVIWLDDLDRLIGADGITDGALRRLADANNALVATLRAHQYDTYMPTEQLRASEWDVVSVFERVMLGRELSIADEARLAQAIDDREILDRIQRIGLGEYVGAAEQISGQLRLGRTVNPIGYALVRGAADWWLMGITEPVPAEFLPDLARPHLDSRSRPKLNDPTAYQDGVTWATRQINPTVCMLSLSENNGYLVFDYALDSLAQMAKDIPESTWQLAIDRAPVEKLVDVGYQSAVTYDCRDIAEQAWRKAADTGDANAMSNLGALLEQRGDTGEAERWYRKAADTGHANAMSNLGALLEQRGETGEAERWYRKAADTGHANAMYNLGALLEQRGDTGEAERWYRKATGAGQADPPE